MMPSPQHTGGYDGKSGTNPRWDFDAGLDIRLIQSDQKLNSVRKRPTSAGQQRLSRSSQSQLFSPAQRQYLLLDSPWSPSEPIKSSTEKSNAAKLASHRMRVDPTKRYDHMKLPPVEHTDVFLNREESEHDDKNDDIPTMIRGKLLKSMEPSDVVIVVEHCCDCSKHRGTVRHDPFKYKSVANSITKYLAETVHSCCLNVRLGVMQYALRKSNRLGALEIYLFYKGPNGAFEMKELHSKIASNFWPSTSLMGKRLRESLSDWCIQILSLPDKYPVLWLETSLSNKGWDYAADSTEPFQVMWVFDCREMQVGHLVVIALLFSSFSFRDSFY